MFVKPANGNLIYNPKTGAHMPAEGLEVLEGDKYWRRRLRDGDVVIADPPVAKPKGRARKTVSDNNDNMEAAG